MLFEFTSRATGTITMTDAIGTRVLAVIGRQPEAKGVITVAQLPAAIAALEAEVAAEKAAAQAAPGASPAAGSRADSADDRDDDDADEGAGDSIHFAQRAWPLLEMLRRAQAGDADVTWGV